MKFDGAVVISGGFDPIHIGHLRIAVQLRDLGFDRVLLIPNRIPPHRPIAFPL